jgi:hypothetical protein
MNCPECQDLLQRKLDGETVGGEALEFHLSQCATCREQHLAAQRLVEGLQQLPTPQLPAHFASSVVSEVLLDRRQRRNKMQRRVLVTMALAASVVLMLLAAYWWIPREARESKLERAHNPPPIPEKVVPETPRRTEPRNRLAALSERWAERTREHANVVLVATNLDAVGKLPPVGDIPGLEAGQEVSDGVRTVTRSARRALDFLARELPMPEVVEQKN